MCLFWYFRKKCQIPTYCSIRLFSFMIHVQFPTTQKQNKTWGFFFCFYLLQTRTKGGPLLAREDDAIILERQMKQTLDYRIWAHHHMTFDTSSCGWFCHLIFQRIVFPRSMPTQEQEQKWVTTVWTIILLTTKKFTLLPQFPKAIQDNVGS